MHTMCTNKPYVYCSLLASPRFNPPSEPGKVFPTLPHIHVSNHMLQSRMTKTSHGSRSSTSGTQDVFVNVIALMSLLQLLLTDLLCSCDEDERWDVLSLYALSSTKCTSEECSCGRRSMGHSCRHSLTALSVSLDQSTRKSSGLRKAPVPWLPSDPTEIVRPQLSLAPDPPPRAGGAARHPSGPLSWAASGRPPRSDAAGE